MSNHITTKIENNVGILILNRPEKQNALTQNMYLSLTEILSNWEKTSNIKVILIYGAGGNFTSGNDIHDFMTCKTPKDLAPVLEFITLITKLTKPIIAAVEGNAIGIGTTLLFYCDLVFAESKANFHTPFTALGLCPEAGSSLLMPIIIGKHHSSKMLLLSEPVDAVTAKEMGFVSEIITKTVYEHSLEKAIKIAGYPTKSVLETKKLLKSSIDNAAVLNTIEEEAKIFFDCLQDQETQKHLAKKLEKKRGKS